MARNRGLYAAPAVLGALMLMLSACASGDTGAQVKLAASTQQVTRAVDAPAPADVRKWLDYDRPAEFESVQSKVSVPTRDGSDLACRISQPGKDGKPDSGKHPGIVLEFTPYDKNTWPMPEDYFAERGYNVLVCDVRGAGDSDGDYTSWFPAKEAEDNYDVIEWLAARPDSTGKIAQMGASYGSITAYRVAALRPPHLTTIVPIASPTNIYSDWIYPGGIPSGRNQAHWAAGGPDIDAKAHASVLANFQKHPLYDRYWQQIATTNKLKDVKVPTLHIGGYSDIFKEGSFDAFQQRPDQTWLFTGPWTHYMTFVVPGVEETKNAALSPGTVLQWFDHWLAKRDGAGLPPSKVISYESTSTADVGEWKQAEQWPSPAVKTNRLYPTADGTLSTKAPSKSESSYSVNPNDGPSVDTLGTLPTDPTQDQALSEAGELDERGRYGALADPRTTFTLAAFDKDTSVEGPVSLHLKASSTTKDTYFVSKLEVVTEDGKVMPIETGYLRAQLRNGLDREVPVPTGRPVDYQIDLGNTHWKFKAGESLRVTLSGGDAPKINPDAPAGIITVHHGAGTYVDIPID